MSHALSRTHPTRACTHATVHARTPALINAHTQTRTAPEQNSIINGLIARVELLWESEPATLNKIKPLLYIFIIPNRVLNCKCVSENPPSPLPSSPSLPFPSLLCPVLRAVSLYGSPLPRCLSPYLAGYMCAHARTDTHTFRCCGMYVWSPLGSLIKGKGCEAECVCVCEREELCA